LRGLLIADLEAARRKKKDKENEKEGASVRFTFQKRERAD